MDEPNHTTHLYTEDAARLVYLNPDATDFDVMAIQEALDHVDADVDNKLDYSVQCYTDGFGRVVTVPSTVHTHAG